MSSTTVYDSDGGGFKSQIVEVISTPILISSVGLSEEILIYQAVGTCEGCGDMDVLWGPFVTCGKTAMLSPDNTQILLTLPGRYSVGDPVNVTPISGDVNISYRKVPRDLNAVLAQMQIYPQCEEPFPIEELVAPLDCICEATNLVAEKIEAQTEEIKTSGESSVTALEAIAEAIIDSAQPAVALSSPLGTIDIDNTASNVFTLDIDPEEVAELLTTDPDSLSKLKAAIDTYIVSFRTITNPDDSITIFAKKNTGQEFFVATVGGLSTSIVLTTLVGNNLVLTYSDGTTATISLAAFDESLAFLPDGITLKYTDGNGGTTTWQDGRISADAGNTISRGADGGLKSLGAVISGLPGNAIQTLATGLYVPEEKEYIFKAKLDYGATWTAPIGWSFLPIKVEYDPFGLVVPGENYIRHSNLLAKLPMSPINEPWITTSLLWDVDAFPTSVFSEIVIIPVTNKDTGVAYTRKAPLTQPYIYLETSLARTTSSDNNNVHTTLGFYVNNVSMADYTFTIGSSDSVRMIAAAEIVIKKAGGL